MTDAEDNATRLAPVQGEGSWPLPPRAKSVYVPAGFISWEEHLKAYEPYARRYGMEQSAERIAERGGFGFFELVALLGWPPRTWRPR